jgi:hypothetical protein
MRPPDTRCVAPPPLLFHPRQNRHRPIDGVMHPDLVLSLVLPVEPPGVLGGAFPPRHGDRREPRVQPRVVEPLSDEPPGREEQPLFPFRDGPEPRRDLSPLLRGRPAVEDDEVASDAPPPLGIGSSPDSS